MESTEEMKFKRDDDFKKQREIEDELGGIDFKPTKANSKKTAECPMQVFLTSNQVSRIFPQLKGKKDSGGYEDIIFEPLKPQNRTIQPSCFARKFFIQTLKFFRK